jgi:4-carboxymuconolactone decarboxylase
MRLLPVAMLSLAVTLPACAQMEKITLTARAEVTAPMVTREDVQSVAPALDRYTQTRLLGELWKRPELSPRDRSLVTIAALIARNQMSELPYYLNFALENGVRPSELSEVLTHLAFYSGRGNALAAVPLVKAVFAQRNIGTDQLAPAAPSLLPLNEAAEGQRAARVGQQFGAVAPGLVQYTTDVLFRDLWLRPALAPRDRSLVTISALIGAGQVAQLTSHLNLGMDNGLTQAEAGEIITHLAFYAGWPNAFSAVAVAKEVFEKRPR